MLCLSCNEIREEKDFYGKKSCFKCTYAEKTKEIRVVCKVCKQDIHYPKVKYCSKKCADEEHQKMRNQYWFRMLPKNDYEWNARFSSRKPEPF